MKKRKPDCGASRLRGFFLVASIGRTTFQSAHKTRTARALRKLKSQGIWGVKINAPVKIIHPFLTSNQQTSSCLFAEYEST